MCSIRWLREATRSLVQDLALAVGTCELGLGTSSRAFDRRHDFGEDVMVVSFYVHLPCSLDMPTFSVRAETSGRYMTAL
jgi:hypothetical protein